MKSPSQDFIDNEEAIQARPLEIYELYNTSENYYWTAMDHNVPYGGNTYVPKPIKRSTIEQSADLSPSKMTIDIPWNIDAIPEAALSVPIEDYSIKVTRLFEDDLTEGVVLFIGDIESSTFKGPMARASCVSRHSILSAMVPRFRYQVECNWEVYGNECTLNQNSWKTTTTATIVSGTNYTQMTSDDFDITASGTQIPYFRHGWLEYGDHKRSIIEHDGVTITIDYRIPELETTGSVNVFAGCDWRVQTCSIKFSNMLNFGGDPEIPRNDNPTMWV